MPVVSHERLQKSIGFLDDFVGILSEMGLAALQREQKHEQLGESEERYRRLFDNAAEGLIVFRVERESRRARSTTSSSSTSTRRRRRGRTSPANGSSAAG